MTEEEIKMAEKEEVIILPESLEELHSRYFSEYTVSSTIMGLSIAPDTTKFFPAQKIVHKYCGGALLGGRALNSAIIFMAGASGSGKSSTINALFDDNNLCKTSDNRSETEHVAVVRKLLTVTGENPPVQGYLNFVDVPGSHDTDRSKEIRNRNVIRNFRNNCPELRNRSGLYLKFTRVEKNVYPNVVMFVIDATDERLGGKDSRLAQSLASLKASGDLIDDNRNNVIVVLTHAASLGLRPEKFQEKFERRCSTIKEQFQVILNISDVEVIPVENLPEDYNLEQFGDFYKLPNGDLSHYNLLQAIIQRFKDNGDLLGRLLVSHYTHDGCIERCEKAEISIFEDTSGPEHACDALEMLTVDAEAITPVHSFNSLVRGYCPVTEETKSVTPLLFNGPLKEVQIGDSKFQVPEGVSVSQICSSEFRRISFFDKKEYQDHMKNKYGLDVGFNLVVKTGSEGRWVNDNCGGRETSLFSMAHEKKVPELRKE